jgi:heat shock protein HtpX
MTEHPKALRRRALVLLAVAVLPIVLVALVVGALLSAPLVGLVVGAVAALAAAVAVDRMSERVVVRSLQASPADPHDHARALNLVEGLCAMVGIPAPTLLVLDDPSLNALATAGRHGTGTVVLTSGLHGALSRVEMEGVVAEQLSRIKRGDAGAGTSAAMLRLAVLPGGASLLRWVTGGATAQDADEQAVRLTRYPPGLAAALVKLRDDTTPTESATRANAHLWLEPPGEPLEARIEALREL